MLLNQDLQPTINKNNKMKKILGIVVAVLGIIGASFVHSMRPPKSIGDAFMMMANNQESYIEAPWYQIFLGVSILVALAGLGIAFVGFMKKPAK